MNWTILTALLAGLILSAPGMAAEQRIAQLLWRGVEEFDKANVQNAMEARVRRSAKVAGVPMDALFLHPLDKGRAVAEYPAMRRDLGVGQRLFFLGHVGISDGFDWEDKEHPPDGVRFYVVLNGKDVATSYVRESKWTLIVASLGESLAEKDAPIEATLSLATDSGPEHNSSYDWALFGEPVVVWVDGRPIDSGPAVTGANGVLVAQIEEGAGELLVEGLDAEGDALEGAIAATEVAVGTEFSFVRFEFADHEDCVAWRWRAEGVKVAKAWGGSWRPRMWMEYFGPAQTVTFAGEPQRVRVAVRNKGMGSVLPEHGVEVECNDQRQPLQRLGPDETRTLEFRIGAGGPPPEKIRATVSWGEYEGTMTVGGQSLAWPPLPDLPPERPERAQVLEIGGDYLVLENPQCRWVIWKNMSGLGALVYAWMGEEWELTGAVAPWVEFALSATGWGSPGFPVIGASQEDAGVRLEAQATLGAGITCNITAKLPDDSPAMRVEIAIDALEPKELVALRGPAVHAGDRTTGTDKGIAIFPGLEYLDGEERSSSTRDLAPPHSERWVPHKFKVTVPMMMVETREGGPVMGVVWDPRQKWDGEHIAPAACFASPDFITLQDNHLMQLMLPATPDFMPENKRWAHEPVALEPGKPWRLVQYIIAGKPEPDATGALEWFDELIGYPQAEEWPRSFEEEIALCRHGFMKTVWDEETKKSRHVVGWGPANSPGHAVLLLMDARAVAQGADKTRVMDRVNLVGEQTVRQQGASGLSSRAGCHIMAWEFPYHWGHVPGALKGMRDQAYAALQSQQEDGAWGYYPDERRKALGERGTRVAGICGRNAYMLAKYAAISGDPMVLEGLNRALVRMRQFKVPRGAQGWECPILEPDVLASAYALRACVWGYMATGDERCLEDARYWARTGLPFQYAWDDGEHPGMRYASIPVFGSTFFHHSWIGLPVQWCGLVYAYGLQELVRFDQNDLWRRQAEGMTVSAMYQQWPMDNEELAGSYPDSYGNWFTRRNPVHINPEDIEVNLLALKGLDPGLRSVPFRMDDGLVHITAPADIKAGVAGGGLQIEVTYLAGEIMYLTVAPVVVGQETKVTSAGAGLTRVDDLPPGSVGWAYNEQLRIMTMGVKCDDQGVAKLSIGGIERGVPETPRELGQWEFEEDAAGWQQANSCQVTWQDGAMRITTTGDDPYALSGPANIDAERHKKPAMRVRLTGGNAVGLFWRSTVSPGWGEDKHMNVPVPADGQWHEIEFDLSQQELWAGKVLQIRVDIEPADAPVGTALDVDWIRPR